MSPGLRIAGAPLCGEDDCPNARQPGTLYCLTCNEAKHARRFQEDRGRRVIGGDAPVHVVGVSIERVTEEDGADWRLP